MCKKLYSYLYIGIGSQLCLAIMMNSFCVTCLHQLRCRDQFSVTGHFVSLSFSLSLLPGDTWFPWNTLVLLGVSVFLCCGLWWIFYGQMTVLNSTGLYKKKFMFGCSSSFCGIHCLIFTFLCMTNNTEHIKSDHEVWSFCVACKSRLIQPSLSCCSGFLCPRHS